MASQLVGLENLPNIYIRKVTMKDNNTQVFTVSVDLEIPDRIENGKSIWSNDDNFSPFIKACFIHTVEPSLASELNSGIISPLPSEIIKSQYYSTETSTINIMSIQEFTKSYENNLTYFRKQLSLDIADSELNSTIYTFVYLDTQAVANHWRIEMSGDLSQYHGAVASEKILENGVIPRTTKAFVSSDNTLWTGPVHFSPVSGYMQGSAHTESSHGSLTLVTVSNLKFIDDRTLEYKSKQQIETQENPIISDAYYSVDTFDNLTGVFGVNIKQLVLSKTKNGKKMLNLSEKLFNKFVASIKLNSLMITRQQVKTRRGTNSIGSPEIAIDNIDSYDIVDSTVDDFAGSLKNTDKLKQMFIEADSDVRYYSFFDNTQNSNNRNEYMYKVEITFVDQSQQFLNNEIQNLHNQLDSLRTTINFLNNPSRYDYNSRQLKSGIVPPDSIIDVVVAYYDSFSMINEIDVDDISSLVTNKLSAFASANYTVNIGEKFLNDYEKLTTEFLQKFQVFSEQGTTTSANNIFSSNIPNIISISKEFSEIIKFSDYNSSYDYLGSETQGLPVLSKSNYRQRSQKEIDKFFDSSKSYLSEDLSSLGASMSSAITDFSKSKFLFFSPLGFQFDNQKFDISDLATIDTDQITTTFIKSDNKRIKQSKIFRNSFAKKRKTAANSKNKRTKKVINQPKKSPSLTFERAPAVLKINNLEQNPKEINVNSSEYLGDNSDFINISNNFKIAPEINDNIEIAKSIAIVEKTSIKRNKNTFDVTTRNNTVERFTKSKKFSRDTLVKAPIAFKAMVASRTPAAKNNLLESEVDILKDTGTKTTTEMVFQTTQKVQVLNGFEKDKNGISLMAKPIWVDMDLDSIGENQKVICRMVYAEINELDIKPSPEFLLAVNDKVFIVSDSDIYARPFETIENTDQFNLNHDLSNRIKFATTNVIVQNPNKSALNISNTTATTGGSNIMNQSSTPTQVSNVGFTGTSFAGGSY